MTVINEACWRLVISCPDCVGIVAKVSQFIAQRGGWLTEASYHSDTQAGWFFMRTDIRADSLSLTRDEFEQQFAEEVALNHNMTWRLIDSQEKKSVILMASKASHCVAELLQRWQAGDLHCNIAAVIANHPDLQSMSEWCGVPFHYVPVDKNNKAEHFLQVEQLWQDYNVDTIALARYMQILPQNLCEKYAGKIINIHHSFLPSFIGANPYKAAYDRGVKLIGATCHFVTEDLDEGPIIEQDVIRVSHRHRLEDLVRQGKDVEKIVLANGLRLHLEDRVMIHGNKTVVFE